MSQATAAYSYDRRQPCGPPTEQSTLSFWHTQPSPLLTAHRSTRHLPAHADVVIIGSGITGTSVAHHLLNGSHIVENDGPRRNPACSDSDKSGPRVVMLEAREACWGATGRNGGHCKPLLLEHPNDPEIAEFEMGNFYAIQALIHTMGIDCEFVSQPGVDALESQAFVDRAELALYTMQNDAPDIARLMRITTDPDELARLRIPNAKGALITNNAARLWPYKFVSAVLENLIKSTELEGEFNLQTLTPVESIKQNYSGSWTIQTSRGSIDAPKVVLATNAYTSHLVPSFADLIVPCLGHMSALRPLPSVAGEDRLRNSMVFEGEGIDDYLIQRPNDSGGHLMFGGGRQEGPSIGVTDDSVVDEKVARYLRTRLIEALDLPEGKRKRSAEFEASNVWTGIMGFSRDDLPWVGPVPDHPNVFMSAGYTGHGMPNAWIGGLAVAAMVQLSWGSSDPWVGVEEASSLTRLPKSYLTTPERFARARSMEHIENRDWAEMERGRRIRNGGRPVSGYA